MLSSTQPVSFEYFPDPVVVAPHPPVLIVPEVLTLEECGRLIEVYQTRGNIFMPPGPGIDYNGKDYKMRIPEHE